jgi:hypothetical protein
MRRGKRFGVKDPALERHLPADVLAYHRLGPVVEQLVRDTAKVLERRAVTRPEGDQVLRARQPTEALTRVAEHHVEAVQRQLQPRAAADRLLVGPIDLRLMPGPGLEPLLGPPRGLRPRALDIPADRVVAALEPVIADQVLMHPGGQQPGLRGQPLIDQRLELIQLRRHPLAPIRRLRPKLQIPLHRPPVPAEHPADLRVRVALTRKRPNLDSR